MSNPRSTTLALPGGKATLPAIKQHNSRLVLRLLRERGALSRAELARLTHLSRPAVSDIVQRLVDEGLIEEAGIGSSQGGKRPTLMSLRAGARQAVVVDLGGSLPRGLRADLQAQVLAEAQSAPAAGEAALQGLYDLLDRLLEGATSPVLGIAVAAPGLIDSAGGRVLFSANLGWRDVPLARLLDQRYGLPVFVENDTHLTALGEFHFGAGQGQSPLAVARVGLGIGAGLIVDGRIYAGANGWSGEIGHLTVVKQGHACRCGRQGCLETVASAWGLALQAGRLATEYPATVLDRLACSETLDVALVLQALERGDPGALALVRGAGYHLGVALAALLHIFDPRRIVVAGSIAQFGAPLFDALRQGLERNALPALVRATEILPARLGEQAGLLGAVALVLSRELGVF